MRGTQIVLMGQCYHYAPVLVQKAKMSNEGPLSYWKVAKEKWNPIKAEGNGQGEDWKRKK